MRSVGIDLTQSSKPSSIAMLSDGILVRLHDLETDAMIVSLILSEQPHVVAIDSPLFLPFGLCCLEESCTCVPRSPFNGAVNKGRACERVLSRRGIGSYYTTKRSIIKKMIYRAIALKQVMESAGLTVIEVYPYATSRILFGKLPKKTTRIGIDTLREKLMPLVGNTGWPETHDELDAVLAAYTGHLYLNGRAEGLGNLIEGQLWVPK